METNRPQLKLPLTPADIVMEAAGGIAVAALWAIVIYSYNNSPDMVPVHFDLAGNVDSYAEKRTVFILPCIATVIFIVMTAINAYPHLFNYPGNITPENAERQYRTSTRLIRFMKFAVPVIFAVLEYQTYRVASTGSSGFDNWVIPLCMGLIFLPMIFYMIQASKSR
jgi:uncharacterized membrane protein